VKALKDELHVGSSSPPPPPLPSPPLFPLNHETAVSASIFGSCSDLTCRVFEQDCLETGRMHPPACRIHGSNAHRGYFTAVVCGKDEPFLLKVRMRNVTVGKPPTSGVGPTRDESRSQANKSRQQPRNYTLWDTGRMKKSVPRSIGMV
jgi:hypothetical protein